MMWKFMMGLGFIFLSLGSLLVYVNSYNPGGSAMYAAMFQMFGSALPLLWYGNKIRKEFPHA